MAPRKARPSSRGDPDVGASGTEEGPPSAASSTTSAAAPDIVPRHRRALVWLAVLWVISRLPLLFAMRVHIDPDVYRRGAEALFAGLTPWLEHPFEYPPGALVISAVPRLFTATAEGYRWAFAAWTLLPDAVAAWLVFRLGAGPRLARLRTGVVATSGWLLCSALLGDLILQRLDLFIVVGILAALVAMEDRHFGRAEVLLVAVVWMKVIPIVIWPAYVVHRFFLATHDRRELRTVVGLTRWMLGEGRAVWLRLVGGSLLLWLPFALWSRGALFEMGRYHTDRGLQLESVWASALMGLRTIGVLDLEVVFHHGALHIAGDGTGLLSSLAFPTVAALQLGALAAIAARRRRRSFSMLGAAYVLLLGAIIAAPVLSPQFLLFLFPLGCVVAARARSMLLMSACVVAAMASGSIISQIYLSLIELQPIAVLLLLLRNGLLVAMLIAALAPPRKVAAGAPPLDEEQRQFVERVLLMCTGFVAFVAGIRTLAVHDLPFQVRLGADILATGIVPITDVYGAAGPSADWVAHEWLAATFFAAVERSASIRGLVVVQGILGAAAIVGLMAVLAPRRRGPLLVPTLLLTGAALYPFSGLSPQLLGTVMLVAFLAVARRATFDDVRWVLAVALLTGVWANVHASAALAIPILLVSGAVRARAHPERRHVAALLPALGFLALLANPRGIHLVTVALAQLSPARLAGTVTGWRPAWEAISSAPPYVALWILGGLTWMAVGLGGARHRATSRGSLEEWTTLLLALGTALLAFDASLMPAAAVLMAPALLVHGPRAFSSDGARFPTFAYAGALVVIAVTLLSFQWADLGFRFADRQAFEAAAATRGIGGSVLCSAADAPAVLAAAGPRAAPVIDHRHQLFEPALLEAHALAMRGGLPTLAFVERHQVDIAILEDREPIRGNPREPALTLRQSGAWRVEGTYGNRVVLVRIAPR